MRNALKLTAAALALAAAGSVMAQPYGRGEGYGPGGGYGPGMMRGYGGGMMGYGGFGAMNLTEEQRDKVFAIQEEARAKNFGTMTKMRQEQYKLSKMFNADKVDAKAVGEQQKKVDELRRQLIQSRVETRNQIEAILTPEQKKQLRQYGPWWLQGDAE